MARIVNIGAVLPEDIQFVLPDGRKYVVPGDVQLDVMLNIARLCDEAQAQAEDAENNEGREAAYVSALERLDEEIVGLLQVRNPDVTRNPFGLLGTVEFIEALFREYGTMAGEDPTKGATETKPPAKRSKRSNGSPSS